MDPSLPRYSPSLSNNGAFGNDPLYEPSTDQGPHTSAMAYADNIRFRRAPATSSTSNAHPLTGKGRDSRRFDDEGTPILGDPDNATFKAFRKTAEADKHRRKREIWITLTITVIACFVRLWKLNQPSSVVGFYRHFSIRAVADRIGGCTSRSSLSHTTNRFDEVHFGGFASKYIRGKFFMDVHPPLAKMLIALAAKLAGFNGQFDFKEIGMDYIEPKVPYISMRFLTGVMGVLVVPTGYLTIRAAGHSIASAVVAAFLLTFENGLITNNRLILLDSPLLFFTAATGLMWMNFHNQQNKPFRFWWWVWLTMTGVGLGLTVSCKWVGLFTIATIGTSTIKNLWDLLGDLRVSIEQLTRHFMARALCLILVPLIIYIFMFQIHFMILPNSGDGDGFMSSEFQQTLGGHGMADTPVDIAYGSKVYIRHIDTHGGYLHSHAHNYPAGSQQQQITLYPHKDDNNWWIIKKQYQSSHNDTALEWVRENDVVRLEHVTTEKRLHSHDVRPSLTDLEYHNEVSGYGFPGFEGDANDYWRVEIYDHEAKDSIAKERLRTLHSKFRLIHTNTGCALFSHSVKLPDWGFEQQEVTCIKGGKLPKTTWFIEATENPLLPPDTEMVNYRRLGFFGKFAELNRVMWNTNKGLTESHPYDSRPPSWPVLRRGISFWGKDHKQVYLLGNPLVFWGSTVAIFTFVLLKAFFILRQQRGYKDHFGGLRQFYDESAGFLFVAWFFHFFPFFLMARQLFLHHYMPALYFAVLLFAVGFDLATIRLPSHPRILAAAAVILAVIYVFTVFAPITYGNPWTKADCGKSKWLETWDYDCNSYHDTYSEYQSGQSVQEAHPVMPLFDKLKQGIHNAVVGNANADAATTENVFLPGEVQVEAGDHVNVVTDKEDDAEQILETSPQQKPTPEADSERGEPRADEVEDSKGQPGAEVAAEATGDPAKHEDQKEVKREVDSAAQEQEDENTKVEGEENDILN
ncbi:Dolichyl-phosphate-mannose-protein mannosyltransferase-domain-containing protein [Endogone sp. FLAS-F59071]|nr:Dolichyl-phosphate-mannose-protein mannosyltransferase-domain-containing protein [Endogone sp. FLAS-F59071]|eukprot:RUS19622.1 Dolichyl-phosphate-mannose-protein mannosyltransferase-domain-containing protein [Endogone sp. FLAS-F59071]